VFFVRDNYVTELSGARRNYFIVNSRTKNEIKMFWSKINVHCFMTYWHCSNIKKRKLILLTQMYTGSHDILVCGNYKSSGQTSVAALCCADWENAWVTQRMRQPTCWCVSWGPPGPRMHSKDMFWGHFSRRFFQLRYSLHSSATSCWESNSFFYFTLSDLCTKFIWVFTALETKIEQIETLKYNFGK
jgi:hypothetical protein